MKLPHPDKIWLGRMNSLMNTYPTVGIMSTAIAIYVYLYTHTSNFQSKTVSQFYERLAVPLFGYSSVDEWYRATRNSDKLHKICIPYISITATDDPFVPEKCKVHIDVVRGWILDSGGLQN